MVLAPWSSFPQTAQLRCGEVAHTRPDVVARNPRQSEPSYGPSQQLTRLGRVLRFALPGDEVVARLFSDEIHSRVHGLGPDRTGWKKLWRSSQFAG